MLADDIGRRSHLKVIQLVNTGYEIGVVIGDAVVCVRAEEQRFRWFRACLSRSHICPKREDARLWVVPARLVQFYVELKCGCFVGAWRPYLIAIIVDAGFRIKLAAVPSGLKLGCKRCSWYCIAATSTALPVSGIACAIAVISTLLKSRRVSTCWVVPPTIM